MRQGRTPAKTRLLLSLLFLLNAAYLHSQTAFFVAPNGIDSNPGTEAKPFLTIARGLSLLSPGKTLYIKSGTYSETLGNNVPAGSSWSSPVTVAVYPGNTVTILPPGGDHVFNPAGSRSCYIILRGLTLDARNVILDAVKIDQSGTNVANSAHHIRIQDCEIRNAHAQGILMSVGTRYNEIRNCSIHDNGVTDFCHGIYITSACNLVDGCQVFHNAGWGIHVYEEGAIEDSAHDNTVCNNLIYDNAALGARGFGIGLYAGNNNVAYNNVLWNNHGAIAIDYGATNTRVCNNTCYGNSAGGNAGICVGAGSSAAILRNNIVVQSGTPISNSGSGTIQEHNLLTDPGFVDPAGHDFHLKSPSAAIDAGVAVSGFSVDCSGVPRPQGSAWDIGAYEYTATGSLPPPAGASPADGATGVSTSPTLQWTPSAGAASYRLQVATDPDFSNRVYDNGNLTSTSQALSGLAAGTTYYWRVSAAAAGVVSPWSQTRGFTTAAKARRPHLKLTPGNLDFGDIPLQQTRTLALIISNDGDDTLRIADIKTPDPIFSVLTRTLVLAPGASLTDTIIATAPSAAGPVNIAAVVASDSETEPDTIGLQMSAVSTASGVNKCQGAVAFSLCQNFPNPFNPSTTIGYALPEQAHVTLTVFNALGQRVADLINGRVDAGYHQVQFSASHFTGLPSGFYFYRLVAGNSTQTKEFLLLR